MGRLRRLLVAVLATSAIAACTGGGGRPSGGPNPTTAAPLAPWTAAGPAPLSRLAAAGGHVVYLAAGQLVALDPASGAVVWERDALVPPVTDGQRPSFLVEGDRIDAFEQLGGRADASSLVELDANDGSVRWRAVLPALPLAPPSRCGDAACVVVGSPTVPAALIQVDRSRGTTRVLGRVAGAPVVALAGDVVLSVVGSDLVLADQGASRVVWRVPVSSLAGAVPPVRWRAWPAPDGRWVVWADGRYTGISAAGVRLWTTVAQPCPFVADDTTRVGQPALPILVCFGSPLEQIAALEPATGVALWQVSDAALADPTADVVRTGDNRWLLAGRPGPRLELDAAEGPRAPSDSVTGGWCGTIALRPCDVAGQPLAQPGAVPAFAGLEVGGIGVWVEGTAVRGAPLR